MKTYILRSLLVACLLGLSFHTRAALNVHSLQCEGLDNPLAIDNTAPHFSWRMTSDRHDSRQTAYQIMVASSRKLLAEGKADMWNSGKVQSDLSVWVLYNGKRLDSKSLGYWKVRVWDEDDRVTPWSAVATFGVGLLRADDWKAKYIGMDCKDKAPESPQLRKTFRWGGGKDMALLHVNSLGYHEVHVNGRPVTDAVLTPAVAQYDKRSMTVTYDVTSLLRKGDNDIVIWLGKGWYNDGLAGVVRGGPFVRAQLERRKGKGWTTLLVTDRTWLAREGGYISTWKKGKLGGEEVDGAMLLDDFTAASLNRVEWGKAREAAIPAHKATPQMVEMNRIVKEIHPISCRQINDSTWVLDMGTNFTGWTRLRLHGLKKGQQVRLNYCDHLNPHGAFRSMGWYDLYTASGKGEETFVNKFNYHAYRYVKVSNLPYAPRLEDVTGCVIRTDYSGRSTFACSDKDLTAIHRMIQNTMGCLTLCGNMVDCPHIERLGYGGDGNASTLTLQTMYNTAPMYAHWMGAWSDCMRADDSLPYTAPNPITKAGGGAYWCAFFIAAPWQSYLNYGDRRLLERYYPQMRRWMAFVEKHSPDGLLKPWPAPWYLGDWAPPTGIDPTDTTSVDLVNNCVIVQCCHTMAKIAKVLGRDDAEVKEYTARAERLQALIHKTFYDPRRHSYVNGTQTEMIFPMLVGATPAKEVPGVMATLTNAMANRYKGHLFTGLVGVPVITEWAVKNNQAELVYTMLKKREQPSYLYMLDQGATTTWEWWNGRRSHIHNCYNGIGSWFYQALGGITPDESAPGYRRVLIKPQMVKGVSWVNVTKDTPYGQMRVRWDKKDSSFTMDIELPVGSEAAVTLPVEARTVSVDGARTDRKNGLTILSGKHRIVCEL